MVDGLMMMMILMMRLMVVEEISFLTSLGLYIETSFKGVEPPGASERKQFVLVERSTCLSPYLYLTLPTLFTSPYLLYLPMIYHKVSILPTHPYIYDKLKSGRKSLG